MHSYVSLFVSVVVTGGFQDLSALNDIINDFFPYNLNCNTILNSMTVLTYKEEMPNGKSLRTMQSLSLFVVSSTYQTLQSSYHKTCIAQNLRSKYKIAACNVLFKLLWYYVR